MLHTVKKIEAEKISNEHYLAETLQNVKSNNNVQWNGWLNPYKSMVERNLLLLRKIDGIPLWRINYQLNRLAVKGISKEQLKKGKIILTLPAKRTGETISDDQKNLIEKTIDELEGFENLRLSQFYIYKPVYKEISEVSRWIEIEISEL